MHLLVVPRDRSVQLFTCKQSAILIEGLAHQPPIPLFVGIILSDPLDLLHDTQIGSTFVYIDQRLHLVLKALPFPSPPFVAHKLLEVFVLESLFGLD